MDKIRDNEWTFDFLCENVGFSIATELNYLIEYVKKWTSS